jgi:hypothetical protein
MGIDWGKISTQAEAEVASLMGAEWPRVANTVSAQVGALVAVGQAIEQDARATPPSITAAEYASLSASRQSALRQVLETGSDAASATQAAAAAWNVLARALKTEYGLGFIT